MAAPPGGAKGPANKVEPLSNPSASKKGIKSPGKRHKLAKVMGGSAPDNRNSSSSRVVGGGKSKRLRPKRGDEAMDVDDDLSKVTAAAAVIEEEKPKLREVLEELRARSKGLAEKVATLAARAAGEVAEDPGPRDEGASFFAAKQTLLLSYCREVCSYAAAKATGQAIHGTGVAGRMVELRTVMEKLRPMDRKLKYQTDKLLRLASAGPKSVAFSEAGDDEDDPLSFRPRPEAMALRGEEPDGTGEISRNGDSERSGSALAQTREGSESGLYRVPRLSSVPYDEDGVAVPGGGGARRNERRLEKRLDKLRRGEVMETLREEFGEQPETVKAPGNAGAAGVSENKMKRLLDEDQERLDFEEDHMVRLTVTRKAKKARAQMEKDAGRLETIADVGSAADFVRAAKDADGFGVEMEGGEDDVFSGGRGRRGRGKGKGALGRAMGAVGGSLPRGGKRRGK